MLRSHALRLFAAEAAVATGAAVPRIARVQTLIPIRVVLFAGETAATAYYAKDRGLFGRAGLDVQIVEVQKRRGRGVRRGRRRDGCRLLEPALNRARIRARSSVLGCHTRFGCERRSGNERVCDRSGDVTDIDGEGFDRQDAGDRWPRWTA